MSNTLISKIYEVLHKAVSFGQHLAKTKTNIAQWLLVSTFLENNTWISVNFASITFVDHCTSKDALFGTCTNYHVTIKYLSHFLTQPQLAQQLLTTTYAAIKNKSRIVCGLPYCFQTPFFRFIKHIWHCSSVSKELSVLNAIASNAL